GPEATSRGGVPARASAAGTSAGRCSRRVTLVWEGPGGGLGAPAPPQARGEAGALERLDELRIRLGAGEVGQACAERLEVLGLLGELEQLAHAAAEEALPVGGEPVGLGVDLLLVLAVPAPGVVGLGERCARSRLRRALDGPVAVAVDIADARQGGPIADRCERRIALGDAAEILGLLDRAPDLRRAGPGEVVGREPAHDAAVE